MPIPKPTNNESEDKFLSRCMSDKVMNKEYPDKKQRFAICKRQYKKRANIMTKELQHFDITLEAKASKDDRVINYIAAKDSIVNESGRVFKIDGMDLSYFKKFPSIFFNHNTEAVPIGKAISVRKRGDELRIGVKFAKPEENSFADTIFKLVKNGYINGGSVGVSANHADIEFPDKPIKIGGKPVSMIIHKSELMEFSIVSSPDNSSAGPLNASLTSAIQDGVIDELEANEVKMIFSINKTDDVESKLEQNINTENDEIISLKAKIAELELQLKEQGIEEELEGSVYDALYDEFIGGKNKKDDKSVYDDLYNDLIGEDKCEDGG